MTIFKWMPVHLSESPASVVLARGAALGRGTLGEFACGVVPISGGITQVVTV